MSVRWDPLLVRHLAMELDARLSGERVRAIRLDGAARTLALLLRGSTLAWDLHPSRGAPRLLGASEPDSGDLPLPGRVRRVRSLEDERILVVEILPTRGRGARDLVVELLGNQWNALVVERPSGTLRHVLVRREGRRPARVGIPYEPPVPSVREGADAPFPPERWHELLEPVPPPQRARVLVSGVAWTSSLNAAAFLGADPDPGTALARGYALWRDLAFGHRPAAPVLLARDDGEQPYPWPLPGTPSRPAGTLLDAFAEVPEAPEEGLLPAGVPAHALRRLEAALEAQERRATSLEAELAGLEDEDALRGLGDLVLTRFGEIPAGAAEVVVAGFDGAPVTLTLDPALAPHENAEAFYDRAGRVDRARRRLPGILEEVRTRARALAELLERARAGEATAEEVAEVLPPPGAGPAAADGPAPPYRTYFSSGGLEIRVGRGARHNDDLTFHHAAPGDVWLHARHTAGAHVILRWNRTGNPPGRDLEEAAVLAALHSSARTSGTVPVDWTLRKYVRKPRGRRRARSSRTG